MVCDLWAGSVLVQSRNTGLEEVAHRTVAQQGNSLFIDAGLKLRPDKKSLKKLEPLGFNL